MSVSNEPQHSDPVLIGRVATFCGAGCSQPTLVNAETGAPTAQNNRQQERHEDHG